VQIHFILTLLASEHFAAVWQRRQSAINPISLITVNVPAVEAPQHNTSTRQTNTTHLHATLPVN
jgi:hypothetical protein